MKKILSILAVILLSACTHSPTVPEGFESKTLITKQMQFIVWEKKQTLKDPLHIYIEGSGNPNPSRSEGLILAGKDPRTNVVYLTQPCQYTDISICQNSKIWTDSRYDIGIVNEMAEAILKLAKRYQTTKVELIGYDSGAALAMLLAPRLNADKIITIAGILDTDSYQNFHNKKALPKNNLNPVHELRRTAKIPQIHYVGTKDSETPLLLTEQFISKYKGGKFLQIKKVPGIGHTHWDDVKFDFY